MHNMGVPTILTSIVKWCPAFVIFSHWVTVSFIDEVLDKVEVIILTSIEKWCPAMVVFSHWVTVLSLMRYWTVIILTSTEKWCPAMVVFVIVTVLTGQG